MQGPGRVSPHTRGLSLIVSAACLLGVSACRSTHVVTADATGRPQFDTLTVVYELVDPDVVKLTAAPTLAEAKARPLRTVVASRASRTIERSARSKLRLVIDTPHPDSSPDLALASLQAPAEEENQWRTVARRDLPRSEVELLLSHLANGGLFDSQTRPNGNRRIAVDIDGHHFAKSWTREPRLDRLAVETYDASR